MAKNTDVLSIFDILKRVPSIIPDAPKLIEALLRLRLTPSDKEFNYTQLFVKQVKKQKSRPFISDEYSKHSYQDFNNWVNRLAHQFQARGIKKGDKVVLMLENSTEQMAMSYALSKIGAISALINTSLRKDSLAHCVGLAQPHIIIAHHHFIEAISDVQHKLQDVPQEYIEYRGERDNAPSIEQQGKTAFDLLCSDNPESEPVISDPTVAKDACFYIYTSGTTGMPKASVISHGRWLKAYCAFGLSGLRLKKDDSLYIVLPIYHATAMVVCMTSVIAGGAQAVIRRKFSLSRFWPDVKENNITAFGYVGEICRFLLNAEPHSGEKDHKMTKMIGNGLRRDIWMEFKDRFGVEQICEFYASSEGNAAFFNALNLDGTIGLSVNPFAVVKYDTDEDAPVRDSKGRMIKQKPGDKGLLLAEITKLHPFDGYTEKTQTNKAIYRDVFKDGDAYFNTGDMVHLMGFRHIFFEDRMGDTFRWRAENVCTVEVESSIMEFNRCEQSIEHAIVYGVKVPDCDGRAGMAAIKLSEDTPAERFDLDKFHRHIASLMPAYAVPVFVRFINEVQLTSTFKYQKSGLKNDGFDVRKVNDPIYFLSPNNNKYIKLTPDLVSQKELWQQL
ncbi:long-chain-acyl-CoA synthetase [Veronia pacifica]|uniref:Long-chain-acyl-CoA synthetase n=1 Tax=Veronia pacifica TaxID=1080227 RepID=A0A1C3EDW5_9GAMM|nr:long-chain-acyl-CoA synthetase [Veronia pacifica]ODA31447.1 long-chain-acyl-CoA synthetase [Veronia pacifica]